MPAVDLEGVQKASGFPAPKEVLVDDVALLEASASFFTEEHLPQLKALAVGLRNGALFGVFALAQNGIEGGEGEDIAVTVPKILRPSLPRNTCPSSRL